MALFYIFCFFKYLLNMKNELVVKDNALINASYNLEVTEQRLILLSLVRARETGQGITAESKLQIYASDYVKQFNVTKESAYEALKNAVNNLFNRQFSFKDYSKDGKEIVTKSRWVSQISYIDESAILEVIFAPAVVPLITKLEKQFTTYQLKQVSQLTSKYAIRLYEILIAWRDIGKTPVIDLKDFRYRLGLKDAEYIAMNDFKKRVIEPAINQINKLTDICVKYEQFKTGRIISGFQFSFSVKEIDLIPETQSILKLTDKQIAFFANKLAYDSIFSNQYAEVGEEYKDLEIRLLKKLTCTNFLEKNLEHLKRVGFSVKNQA